MLSTNEARWLTYHARKAGRDGTGDHESGKGFQTQSFFSNTGNSLQFSLQVGVLASNNLGIS